MLSSEPVLDVGAEPGTHDDKEEVLFEPFQKELLIVCDPERDCVLTIVRGLRASADEILFNAPKCIAIYLTDMQESSNTVTYTYTESIINF